MELRVVAATIHLHLPLEEYLSRLSSFHDKITKILMRLSVLV